MRMRRARLKGQRAMYWARRLMAAKSPPCRQTERSTLNPLWRQDRISSTSSDSMWPSSRSSWKTLFSQRRRNGSWGRLTGRRWKTPSGGEGAVGDQAVEVGMEVDERAEGLDGQDAAGIGVLSEQ